MTKTTRPQPEQIFTTGAFCEPRLIVSEVTGEKRWGWVVVSFEDDSYMNGNTVDPTEVAEADKKELLMNELELHE